MIPWDSSNERETMFTSGQDYFKCNPTKQRKGEKHIPVKTNTYLVHDGKELIGRHVDVNVW